jgi:hypothetical protein
VIFRLALLGTAFIAGAAVMSLEFAGVRLVQIDFGSDIDVWGSMISVFLGGMALGAILGGRLADWWPSLTTLGLVLLVAGTTTLLLPVIGKPIKAWASPNSDLNLPPRPGDSASGTTTQEEQAAEDEFTAVLGKNFRRPAEWGPAETPSATAAATDTTASAPAAPEPDGGGTITVIQPPSYRWPSLLAGMLLFGLPSILLGMVSPYSARLYVHELGHMGAGMGRVYGISTIGSIIGTLGTAFYLMPKGTTWLLILNGAVLTGLALLLLLAGGLIRGESLPAAIRSGWRPLTASGQPRRSEQA